MFIPIILGTAREGRQSEKVAKFILQKAEEAGVETELIDPKDFPLSATEAALPQLDELKEKIIRADGYIIVSPEYNHGYPGELKQLLDLFYDEYARKPVGICGVSRGPMGGVRMVEQLRPVLIELGMTPIRESLYFKEARQLFDENSKLLDEAYIERVQKFLDELLWYAKALKQAREEK